jgi:hypothetical protein
VLRLYRCCCLLLFLAACVCPARAEEDTAPATAGAGENKERSFSTGTAFFDDAGISGGIYYFQRDRRRYDPARRRYANNLNHATLQANADFTSGFLGGFLGLDVAVFGSHDIKSTGSPDHEMNFFPWNNPWHPDWNKRRAEDGASVYKALIKAKNGPFWAVGGYFQPAGPTTLGVNWSVMPGTYRGVNAGIDSGGLSVAFAWADAYKSPWFKTMNSFKKNDGETNIPWIWSSGIRYTGENGLMFETAYGESRGHLWNAHGKVRYETNLAGASLRLGYQLYLMGDNEDSGLSPNDNFDGAALQHAVFLWYSAGFWSLKLEGTYSLAPFDSPEQVGYFAYRLTDRNGSSKGAYDIWWDARSDWNAHREKALFGALERKLDDFLPIPGFFAGVSAAFGWDGEAYGVSGHLKEWAFSFDAGYVKPNGPLQGAFIKLHCTDYRNGTDKPSWTPYKNAFQDERDIKIFAGIPFNL